MWLNKKLRYCRMVLVGLLTVVLLAHGSATVVANPVPNPLPLNDSWVGDTANVLSPQTEERLNQMIDAFDSKTGGEIAVVTIEETKSSSPNELATDLFNEWRNGKANPDNAVLLLIAKDKQRAVIKPGKGLNRMLILFSQQLLWRYVTPYLKRQQFDVGALVGVKAIMAAFDGKEIRRPIVPSKQIINGLQDPRQHGQWIVDKAELLNEETEDQLNQQISQLEQETGSEIIVVTVPEARPSASPQDLAKELFERWLVGKGGEYGGYLWLISKHDRRLEVIGDGRNHLPFMHKIRLRQTSINPDITYLINEQYALMRDTETASRAFNPGPHTDGEMIQADGEWGTSNQILQRQTSGGIASNLFTLLLVWAGAIYSVIYLCQWLIYWIKGLFGMQNRQKPSIWSLLRALLELVC